MLGATTLLASVCIGSTAAAACAPDPVPTGGEVICTATDSDGFASFEDYLRVTVSAGATVAAPNSQAFVFNFTGISPFLTNNGTIDGSALAPGGGTILGSRVLFNVRNAGSIVAAGSSALVGGNIPSGLGLVNSGTIRHSGAGNTILLSGGHIFNSGLIETTGTASLIGFRSIALPVDIVNTGTLTAAADAINASAIFGRVTFGGNDATTSENTVNVTNFGTITGNVRLSPSQDTFITRDTARLTGLLDLGAGDDLAKLFVTSATGPATLPVTGTVTPGAGYDVFQIDVRQSRAIEIPTYGFERSELNTGVDRPTISFIGPASALTGQFRLLGNGTYVNTGTISNTVASDTSVNRGFMINIDRSRQDGQDIGSSSTLVNRGTLTIGSLRAFDDDQGDRDSAVRLDNFTTFRNEGTINVSGVNTIGISVRGDQRENNGRAFNSGSIILTDNGTGAFINGGFFENSGSITGTGDGVELVASEAASPLLFNTASGRIEVSRSAVLLRDSVPFVTNEGQLISTGDAAVRSNADTGNRPTGALVINRGSGLIRGANRGIGGNSAIIGADGSETIRNLGSARIEGDIFLLGASDRLTNAATIVGNVDTGESGDTINNSGTIQGSVFTRSGNDYFQWLGGSISGTLSLDTDNDVVDIGSTRVWNPTAIATGGVDAGFQTDGALRDVVSMTSAVTETFNLFETPTSFEGIRLVLENSPGVSTIANQATPYTSGFIWIAGRGAIENNLDITRAADFTTRLNSGIYIDTFRYIPDVGDPIVTNINFINRAAIRAIGTGLADSITVGLRVAIDSITEFTGENAGTIFAEGAGSIGVSLLGSDSNFSNNVNARFVNSGTITATNGAQGLSTARIRRVDTETRPEPGVYNNGTITATGLGGFAVTHGNSWFRNNNLVSASSGASALEIVANSTTINTGTIQSTDAAAVRYFQGDNSFVNTGTIQSTGSAAFFFGTRDGTIGNISIGNAGLIQGNGLAFFGGGSSESIRNEAAGRIVGDIFTAGGEDTIINAGSITGSIDSGIGNDSYANLGGSLSGNLSFGAGDDTLLLNRPSAAASGIAGTIDAGSGASEIDRVQVLISGSQTFDPRATNVLAGFEVLRIDGTLSGETLTLGNPGAAVTTRVEIPVLASNATARAVAINTANFSTVNLSALEVIGGRTLLANGDIGGTVINRGTLALDYNNNFGALRADRAVGLRAFTSTITAGAELINESTITASGFITFVEFGDTKTQIATAVGIADTSTETQGNRVVAPYFTNAASGVVEGINGASAIDTEGGAIIVNRGIIRATNVAGTNPAALDLGNDDVTNSGTIEGLGIGTRAILSTSSLTLTNEATGIVRAESTVIELDSSGARLTNAGTITSTGGESAILTDANSQIIRNTGTISSSNTLGRATMRFLQTFQTTDSGDRNFIFNDAAGRIEKTGGGLAIFGLTDTGGNSESGSSSAEVVFNRGAISGGVNLGDGSDVFYAIGGTQTGDVSLGRDGDVLILADGAISGTVDLGGGEDTVLVTAGTAGVQPTGGIFAGSGVDAIGSLFFASGSTTLQAVAGYEMAAAGAVGYNTTVTLGAIGDVLNVSVRTLGSGQFINRHTVNATFDRAAIEVEDRDQRIINEGTLSGRIGIDDGDLALRIDNRGTINATQFGIAARGDGIELTSETLGTVGRPVFNSGAINVIGNRAVGIFNVSSGEGRTRDDTSLGLTSLFAQTDLLPGRDRPELKRSVLISNTGTIVVTGSETIGIHTDRSNAYIENLGTIRVSGTQATGVLYANAARNDASFNTRFINAGTVEVSGAGADGFVSFGERTSATEPNILVNTGIIRTTGGVVDFATDWTRGGYVVDFARAVEMGLGGISNSATGVIEATDSAGVAIWSTTTRDEPVQNGDDPNTAQRRGVELVILNEGLISGTKGYYAAFRESLRDENGDSRFVYENRFIGAIQGGTGTETIENRGTIRGAINLRNDHDTIRNFGTIDGDVYLGVGEDTFFVGRGSTTTGVVDGELGFDLLQLDLNGDTTFDASRYTSFERLGLLGTGTLNLTGGRLAFETIALGGNGLVVDTGATVAGTGNAITGSDAGETVTVNGTVEGGIALGGGDDRLIRGTGSVVTGTIDGGDGRDTLEIVLTGAPLSLGGVLNFEQLDATGAGTLTVSNTVSVSLLNLSAGNIDILGAGTVSGNLAGGAAAQSFTIAGSVGGNIDAGDGNDTIVVTGSVLGGITLGAGDDSYSETGAGVAGIVDGGSGRDTLSVTLNGNETVDLSRRVNFEVLSKGGTGSLLVGSSLTLDGLTLLSGGVSVAAGADFTVSALGIVGGAGSQSVVNAGRILGGVTLGDDADIVDTSGTITGALALGSGDDILRLRDGGVLQALADGGTGTDLIEVTGANDRLLSASGYANFENLVHSSTGRLTFEGAWTLTNVALNGNTTIAAGASLAAATISGGNTGIELFNSGAIRTALVFGSGNDRFVLDTGSSVTGGVSGGGGSDELEIRLAGNSRFDGASVSSFEQLTLRGTGTLTLFGASAFNSVLLTGSGLEIESGSVLTGSITGEGLADNLIIAASGRVTGAANLAGGDDVATILGQVDGLVDLGAGADRLSIDSGSVLGAGVTGGDGVDTLQLGGAGGSFALANVTGFETLDIQGNVTLTGSSNFTTVALNGTNLTIANGASLQATNFTANASDNILDVRGSFIGGADLGLGNDTLRLTETSALSGGAITGGDGTDTLAIDLTTASSPYTLTSGPLLSFETLNKTGVQQLILSGGAAFAEVRSTGDLRVTGGALTGSIIGDANANRLILESDVGGTITLGASADAISTTNTVSGLTSLGGGDDVIDLLGSARLVGVLNGGDGTDLARVTTTSTVELVGGVTGVERIEKSGTGAVLFGGISILETLTLAEGSVQIGTGAALTVTTGLTGTAASQQLLVNGTFTGIASLGDGDDSLINRGSIVGSIDLGGGNDTAFQTLNATLTGTVDGGAGIDNLIIEVTTQGSATASQFLNFEAISQRGGGEFRLSGNLSLDTITLQESILTLTEGSTLRSFTQPAVQGTLADETVNALGIITGDVRLADGNDVVRLGAAGGVVGLIDGGLGTDRLDIESLGARNTSAIRIAGFESATLAGGSLVVDSDFSVANLAVNGVGLDVTSAGVLNANVIGNEGAQTFNILGRINGAVSLGGGDDFIVFDGNNISSTAFFGTPSGGFISGAISGGAGTDRLQLTAPGIAFISGAAVTDFENIAYTGANGVVISNGVLNSNLTTSGFADIQSGLRGTLTGSDAVNNINIANGASLTGNVSLGAGADAFFVQGQFTGSADLGADDDRASIQLPTGTFAASIDGGAGNDSLTISPLGITTITGTLSGFETVTLGRNALTILNTNLSTSDLKLIDGGRLEVGANSVVTVANTLSSTLNGAQLTNVGTIRGAISLGDGIDSVTNRGLLEGPVNLGAGNDTFFQGLSGRVTQTVDGGDGEDALIIEVTRQGDADASLFRNFESLSQFGGGVFSLTGNLTLDNVNISDSTFRIAPNSSFTSSNAVGVIGGSGIETIENDGTINANIDLGAGNDVIATRGLINGTIQLGLGDDSVTIDAFGNIMGQIDGGAGNDRLTVDIFGSRSLTGFDIQNIETIATTGGDLGVTSAESYPGLFIGGTGVIITDTGTLGGTVTASDSAQTFEIRGILNASTNLGGGDDSVIVRNSAGLGGTIDAGTGSDTLVVSLLRNDIITLNGPRLTNFETTDLRGGDVRISGALTSNIIFTPVAFSEASLTISADGTLVGSITGNVFAQSIVLNGTQTGALSTGDGDDTVVVTGRSNGNIDLGADNDILRLTNTAILSAPATGGAGIDILQAASAAGATLTLAPQLDFETLETSGAGIVSLTGAQSYQTLNFAGASLSVATGATLTAASGINGDATNQILSNAGTLTSGADLGDGADRFIWQTGSRDVGVNGGNGSDTLEIRVATGESTVNLAGYTAFEVLEKTGAGSFALNSAVTISAANVTAGSLNLLSGSRLTTPILTIAQGASLTGTGTVVGLLNVSGTLSPGASPGVMNVTGDVNFNTGSTYAAELTLTGIDQLLVSGRVTISTGTTLAVAAPDFIDGTFDIINATGGLTGTFSTITAPDFLVVTPTYTPNILRLEVLSQLARGLTLQTQSRAAVDAFNSLLRSGAPEPVKVAARQLATIQRGGVAAIDAAFDQLHPESYASASHIGQSAARSGLDALTSYWDGNTNSLETETGWSTWASVTGGFRRIGGDTAQGLSRTSLNSYGLIGGIGRTISDNTRIGLYTGYINADQSFTGLTAKNDGKTLLVGGTVEAASGGFTAQGAITYLSSSVDTVRTLTAVNSVARSDYNLSTIAVAGRVGYTLPLSEGFNIKPIVGLSYTSVKRKASLETGANALNLAVQGATSQSLIGDFGLQVQSSTQSKFMPYAELGLRSVLSGGRPTATAQFNGGAGNAFTVKGAEVSRFQVTGSVGAQWRLTDTIRAFGRYQGSTGSGDTNHAINIGLGVQF